jgi:SiaC family regulatory phosphoprotein
MFMQDIFIPSTDRTPEVRFAFGAHVLSLSGESYPEDAAAFYGPLFQSLNQFAAGLNGGRVVMDLRLDYFNSSSAKALMRIFQLLEDAATKGNEVRVNWHFDPEDDTMQEFGEDFAQDFEKAKFTLCPAVQD